MRILYLTRKRIMIGMILLVVGVSLSAIGLRFPQAILDTDYVILAFNDLGMHCIQPDYSQFFILPPGNNLIVQVFHKGEEPELMTEGIIVKYAINSQDDPTLFSNFWNYAKQYGFDIPKGVEVTGNGSKGEMQLDPSKRYWIASAIPVTSRTGGTGPSSPYQTATITVLDKNTNNLLAQFDKLVVPVSPEMDCLNCHHQWSNILKSHDDEEKTNLFKDSLQGKLHKCSECHADPILDQPGKVGIPSLSLAMHGFHADKMKTSIQPVCYNCHPGLQTKCNRGVMKAANLNCENCHGTMRTVALSITGGRTPWLQEPECQRCHGTKFRVNPGELYRRSFLMNGPASEMNDKILCASCHNSPHSEWPSLLALDNILPETYQGMACYIKECSVCHEDSDIKNQKVHQ